MRYLFQALCLPLESNYLSKAEVLGKRVVVQHIPLGGVLSWSVGTPKSTTIAQSSSMPSNNSIGSSSATLAPWAQGSIGRLNHTSQLARHGASLPSWSTGPSPTMNPRPRALNTHTTSSISPPLSSMSGQGRRTLQEVCTFLHFSATGRKN